MKHQRKFVLMKDLPGCPKGRIFKEDVAGNYFHSMTDEEAISGELQSYKYSKDAVIGNGMWFKEISEVLFHYGERVIVSDDPKLESFWYGIYIGKHPTKNSHVVLTRERPKLKIPETVDCWKYCKRRDDHDKT